MVEPTRVTTQELSAMPRGSTSLGLDQVPAQGTISDMKAVAFEMSKATMLPAAFQGQPAACFFALEMAMKYRVPVLALMRNLYVPGKGQLGIMTEFLHARLRDLALIAGPMRYEFHGDFHTEFMSPDWKLLAVTASATDRESGSDVRWRFDMRTAIAAGWAQRNPNYKADPRNQLCKRAVAGLVRNYYPNYLTAPTEVELQDGEITRNAEYEAVRERSKADLNMDETDTLDGPRIIEQVPKQEDLFGKPKSWDPETEDPPPDTSKWDEEPDIEGRTF